MYRDCIAFAVYSNSQATMDIMLPSPGLEEPKSGQSHNLLNKRTNITGCNGHYASEPGVRGTSCRAIPESIK